MCQDHQLLASSMTWDPKIVTQDCETKPGSVPNIASFPSPFLSCFCFLVRLLCEIPVFAGYVPETIIIMINHNYWLVVSTPLKNISQLGLLFPIYIWKNKKCSKPPTRLLMIIGIRSPEIRPIFLDNSPNPICIIPVRSRREVLL